MTGVLITGGKSPRHEDIADVLSRAEVTVTADSGLEVAAEWGVEPDYIVGDMDSLSRLDALSEYPEDRVRRFATEKDYTDTELGLSMLWDAGCHEVALLGGGGGRLDHLLAILALFERRPRPSSWYTHRDEVEVVEQEFVRYGLVGERISFFPVGTTTCRMSSSGLKWPLDELVWERGDVGISNEVVSDPVRVAMTSGTLIMVRELRPGREP